MAEPRLLRWSGGATAAERSCSRVKIIVGCRCFDVNFLERAFEMLPFRNDQLILVVHSIVLD
jgi:hypothetical protein